MHAQSSAASIRLTARPCSHKRQKQDYLIEDPKELIQDHLRSLHQALKDQFLHVEATYEAKKATYDVKLDAIDGDGGESQGEHDGATTCIAVVEFESGLDDTAKITVESEDEKLASNVRECLQNVATSMAPVPID
mmetsp:Transcript_7111/g.14851  ORF Transcript_7111/g.14851 Transcript_7111/m.14851 type:complete len:135 (+) Transcript_7111:2266-2670(+)